jgi:hypothetical protein
MGLRVGIPPEARLSVSCGCSVVTYRSLCDGLITRPEESYRVWCLSMIVKPRLWGPGPLRAVAACRKKWNLKNMEKWRWTNEWNSPTKNTVYRFRERKWSVWDTRIRSDLAHLVCTLIWEVISPRRVLLISHNPTQYCKTVLSRARCLNPAVTALRAMLSGNHTEITPGCE